MDRSGGAPRRVPLLVGALAVALIGWANLSWTPPEPHPRVVDHIQVLNTSRSTVLLLGWQADRCERLDAASSARVEGTRLVLDVVARVDTNCMAQRRLGDGASGWRMLEAIVLDGEVADVAGEGDVLQVACTEPDVAGCGGRVEWDS